MDCSMPHPQKQGEGHGADLCLEPADRMPTLVSSTLNCERIHFRCAELLDLW